LNGVSGRLLPSNPQSALGNLDVGLEIRHSNEVDVRSPTHDSAGTPATLTILEQDASLLSEEHPADIDKFAPDVLNFGFRGRLEERNPHPRAFNLNHSSDAGCGPVGNRAA
jgi:hypothetical protein